MRNKILQPSRWESKLDYYDEKASKELMVETEEMRIVRMRKIGKE